MRSSRVTIVFYTLLIIPGVFIIWDEPIILFHRIIFNTCSKESYRATEKAIVVNFLFRSHHAIAVVFFEKWAWYPTEVWWDFVYLPYTTYFHKWNFLVMSSIKPMNKNIRANSYIESYYVYRKPLSCATIWLHRNKNFFFLLGT